MGSDPCVAWLQTSAKKIDRLTADRLPFKFKFERGAISTSQVVFTGVTDRNNHVLVFVYVKWTVRARSVSRFHRAYLLGEFRVRLGRHVPAFAVIRAVGEAHCEAAFSVVLYAVLRVLGH